ncbi:MAG: hypothetical protein RDU14_12410 [Melioribacteraceae bacterium]|nr:hypothetical protein [Melioribacteraceae bacterium]
MKRIIIISIVLMSIILMSCEDNSLLPFPANKFSSSFNGKVNLQNQTEYSNTLVYIDSLNRGVSTDSSGNYTFQFTKQDSTYSGEFKVRYFLNDYDMDSTKIMLVKGKLKLDTLNVDNQGQLRTKELKQIVFVEGWTDKQEYRIGEKIEFNARFTNLSNRTIHLFIPSIFNQLGHVGLYNEKYPSIIISSTDPVTLDLNVDISPKGYYEGKVIYTIPKGNYGATGFRHLLPDKYIVVTNFFIEGRLQNQFQSKFNKYVLEEWYKIHRGTSPKLDWFPNKYNFPHIKIIE